MATESPGSAYPCPLDLKSQGAVMPRFVPGRWDPNSDLCVCAAYTFPAEPSSQSPHYLVLTYSCDPRDHIERSSVCFYFSMHKGGLCWHTDTWDIPHLVLKRPLLTDQAKAKRGPSGSGLFLLTQNKQI